MKSFKKGCATKNIDWIFACNPFTSIYNVSDLENPPMTCVCFPVTA